MATAQQKQQTVSGEERGLHADAAHGGRRGKSAHCVWAGAERLGGCPTDFLVPLLPTAVGDDGRVDEGALGGHVLTQQAFHLLWPEAGREVQQFHTPVVSSGTEIRQWPCYLGFSRNTTKQHVLEKQSVKQQMD